ncbi:hypothetical protein KHQ81_02775 [Mycoplasmatota bacterium]|nr:hypothetical protein KHQ81_02775 [Mycoplasmatota bacterium]
MSKLFALIGFIFSIIFFSMVLGSALNRHVWTDWVNVVLTFMITLFFAYFLRYRK